VYAALMGGGAWMPGPGGRTALRGGGETKVAVGEGSAAATAPIPIDAC
jgi:hypothetical protein